MNVALAGTACGQLLSVMEFAFGYPESQESKDRAQQLEELEQKFESDDDSPTDEDAITKEQDIQDAAAHFADTTEPKAKRRRFGQCRDTVKDLVPLGKAAPLLPSTTVKLSETGVSHCQFTSQEESEARASTDVNCLSLTPQKVVPTTLPSLRPCVTIFTVNIWAHVSSVASAIRRASVALLCRCTSAQLIPIHKMIGSSQFPHWRAT